MLSALWIVREDTEECTLTALGKGIALSAVEEEKSRGISELKEIVEQL